MLWTQDGIDGDVITYRSKKPEHRKLWISAAEGKGMPFELTIVEGAFSTGPEGFTGFGRVTHVRRSDDYLGAWKLYSQEGQWLDGDLVWGSSSFEEELFIPGPGWG